MSRGSAATRSLNLVHTSARNRGAFGVLDGGEGEHPATGCGDDRSHGRAAVAHGAFERFRMDAPALREFLGAQRQAVAV